MSVGSDVTFSFFQVLPSSLLNLPLWYQNETKELEDPPFRGSQVPFLVYPCEKKGPSFLRAATRVLLRGVGYRNCKFVTVFIYLYNEIGTRYSWTYKLEKTITSRTKTETRKCMINRTSSRNESRPCLSQVLTVFWEFYTIIDFNNTIIYNTIIYNLIIELVYRIDVRARNPKYLVFQQRSQCLRDSHWAFFVTSGRGRKGRNLLWV